MELKDKADRFYSQIEKHTRDNGKEFYCLKDGAPKEFQDIIHEAHGDMMPDDWKYDFIFEAAAALAETDDPDDITMEPDIYASDRLHWLASHLDRANYVDEAVSEFGTDFRNGIVDLIGLGQMREKEEVLSIIRHELEQWEPEDEDQAATGTD